MQEQSIFSKRFSPYAQAGMVLGMTILLQVLVWIGFQPVDFQDKLDYWIVACAMLLFYVIINSVFSFTSDNTVKYYGRSVTGFLGLAFIGGLFSYIFSGIALADAGSFTWIYTVMAIIFVVFLTIVNLMRKIVEIAKKQDKNLRNER
jgi:hypothetical protein